MHVLSLPPAFALSQDQTLTLKRLIWPITLFSDGASHRPSERRFTAPKHPSVSSERRTTDQHKSLTPGPKTQPQGQTPPASPFLIPTCQRTAPVARGSSEANRKPSGYFAGQSRRLSEDGSAPGPLPRPAPMNRGIRPPSRPVNRVVAVRSVFSVAGLRRACDALRGDRTAVL